MYINPPMVSPSPGKLSPLRIARRVAESVLTGVGADRVGRHANRSRTLVLGYHNVIPHGERACGERSLHLPQHLFAAQLDVLAETHDVVPLSAVDADPKGERPRAIITFDDAYRGALSVGLQEVAKRGMHATVFVAPDLLGTVPWWDRLADGRGGALPVELRNMVLFQGRGRLDPSLGVPEAIPLLPEWAEVATEAEVRAAATQPHVGLGAHSWSHANLAALDEAALAFELERPLELLRQWQPALVPWLAYPYGLTSAAVGRAAEASGYAGAFRTDGGWLPTTVDVGRRFDLPRLSIPSSMALPGFRLRAAGVLIR